MYVFKVLNELSPECHFLLSGILNDHNINIYTIYDLKHNS